VRVARLASGLTVLLYSHAVYNLELEQYVGWYLVGRVKQIYDIFCGNCEIEHVYSGVVRSPELPLPYMCGFEILLC
jgi:hypothetical protein